MRGTELTDPDFGQILVTRPYFIKYGDTVI